MGTEASFIREQLVHETMRFLLIQGPFDRNGIVKVDGHVHQLLENWMI